MQKNGSNRRTNDWMVGQYLRQNDPDLYGQLLTVARAEQLAAAAKRLGMTVGDTGDAIKTPTA